MSTIDFFSKKEFILILDQILYFKGLIINSAKAKMFPES
jgi:hypothetical protein